jgi:molybdopterin converting factor small subunit
MMTITVEFFGIPRQRAGVAATTVQAAQLGEVLTRLERRFPQLAETCLTEGRLRPGYVANLNGERFVTDPTTPLKPGDSLLILSADAGG